LKASSRDFSPNCAISFFRLHLVLYACAARFDVTSAAQNFLETKQALNIGPERKLAAAHTVLHGFVTKMMEKTNAARQLGVDGHALLN